MKYLIFDTETTGLPVNSKKPASIEANNWPHIVSISWVILDTATNEIIKKQTFIVKPIHWIIPEDSTKIHGIRNEHAQRYGYDLKYVMDIFMLEEFDALVAHNLNFDYNVLYNAITWDLKSLFPLWTKRRYCTMMLGKYICKLPSAFYDGYKSPKLSELYEHVFHRKPTSHMLHNSLYDTLILAEIIQYCDELRLKMDLPARSLLTSVENDSKKGSKRVLTVRFDDAEGNE
jgi:DNA polymerase III epsilon subunit-like protein